MAERLTTPNRRVADQEDAATLRAAARVLRARVRKMSFGMGVVVRVLERSADRNRGAAMRYQRQIINGEVMIVRMPDEQATPADPANGVEAENPPGSFEMLMRMFPAEDREGARLGGDRSVG